MNKKPILVNIKDLDKNEVLIALYDGARKPTVESLAERFNEETANKSLSLHDAKKAISEQEKGEPTIGIVNDRVLQVDISEDVIDADLYDRANGAGQAERVIDVLRVKTEANSEGGESKVDTKADKPKHTGK